MKWITIWSFFTDPVLQAATLGSILMCIASSLVGVFAIIKKRSLVGEALSHATYPGIAVGVIVFAAFFTQFEILFVPIVFCGAFLSAYLGLKLMRYLEEKRHVSSDSALCVVLSGFLGIGVLLASELQFSSPVWFQKVHVFLYGQAATMILSHVWMYGIFSLILIGVLLILFPWLKIYNFDKNFALGIGVKVEWLERVSWVLLIAAIVIGIRSVGVVLMAGMLIAPGVAARQFTDKLSNMLLISSLFGGFSGFLGNYFSVNLGYLFQAKLGTSVILPTGPMVLIVACVFAIGASLFAPRKGIVSRIFRKERFKYRCLKENIVKMVYKSETQVTLERIKSCLHVPKIFVFISVKMLCMEEILKLEDGTIKLTDSGKKRAKKIIRYHRLWELYLHKKLGFHESLVHRSAEDMEHIITANMELELTAVLDNPEFDPHDQLIPVREDL